MSGGTKELSIFVDESGSFDSQHVPSRFYVISLVLHDQDIPIAKQIAFLNDTLARLGHSSLCLHAGPMIRREDEFRALEIGVRRKLFHAMTAFARTLPLTCRSFCVDKRYCTSPEMIAKSLVGQLNDYVTAHYDDLSKYTNIKIYYDNGQSQVKEILRQVFSTLPAEFQANVTPERYRLFQVADLICTFRLLKAKHDASIPLSKSEEYFFFGARALYKNYLHPLVRLLS